ncbi:C40 family peptidase [Alkaliphilus hydrothermalis]|uniref:Cell wall-associated NlpC family hydrolase n=1 Tax=Alkaliphilus hydrothermalis TaxID=1482730 RepID=A0ABS2NUV2_9FIRM|nr:NlpC/P60 family protein [Alkaliphilus hydrothermalis]MBM7616359.1 cell wall-associated NlpC family hydrolase [Alkaliphilus hydrothermalis]
MNEALFNEKMCEIVKKYRNVNFVHNGRSTEEGLDCLGFMVLFYKEFGIEIPSGDGQEIPKNWYKKDPQRYIRGIKALGGKSVELDELRPLDLVYFAVKRGVITHTGIMVTDKEFVHMSPRKGFTIDTMARHWRKFQGGVRFTK